MGGENRPNGDDLQTIERYEYSIPKMAEMILSLRKEIDELKEGSPLQQKVVCLHT